MLCLGIESTAHTFGVGIVSDKGEILANSKDVYKPPHGSGIVPHDAKVHHENCKERVLEDALKSAGVDLSDIDLIAFSQGPGLPPCLWVGTEFAKKISNENNIPLIGVNHPVAHIEIAKLTTGAKDPVVIYVSGGNTQILAFAGGRYRVFGETEDISIGNALDTFARKVGLPYPGGPKIEKLAKSGKYVELPYVVKGMDLSFSGIVTAAEKLYRDGVKLENICFSLQETCFSMLVEVTERAVAHTGKKEVVLTGGVAANKRLIEMLEIMCKERGCSFSSVPMEYSGDNGVMISWTGILAYKSGQRTKNFDPISRWRTDEVEISWMK
ncbi:MAG: bifunctional N(6)-L-threonylcarbamoyladenine synthase/serine/threonine protein kinase [Candidatus Aenigmarchaeota archaeon]|nr:bifunctional N(6)-L-threonylcarbamoyladenine synthase/serine/threonine protein kinase [Candidatus Aenigmarchaeota archaeon]